MIKVLKSERKFVTDYKEIHIEDCETLAELTQCLDEHLKGYADYDPVFTGDDTIYLEKRRPETDQEMEKRLSLVKAQALDKKLTQYKLLHKELSDAGVI